MKYKKSLEWEISTVAVLVLLLIFLVLYSGAWTRLFGKSVTSIDQQISSTGDFDKDGVINALDKCPCDENGDPENYGCEHGHTPTNNENKDCLNLKK
ncbi:hypothetical protein HYS31_00500 [Candidatus Woesearchaeota archaeon]|nr:hypothetical protein [Candidatus Woesearchaeota archaeon]